jgi:3-oxoacyl-[acyl-carrier protein] reductase
MNNKGAILVTGAAGAIGSWISAQLLEDGYPLLMMDKVEPKEKLDCSFVKLDLTNFEQVKSELPDLLLQYKVTAVIQLAGLIYNGPIINLLNPVDPYHSIDSWKAVIESNLYSTFYVGTIVSHYMVKNRVKGVIINASSISADGNEGQSAYSAAKAGVEALTKTWAKELSSWGIRSVCIQPGFFDTPSTTNALNEKKIDQLKKDILLKRFGELGEFYHGIQFLLNNHFYNGEILKLNGGHSL